MLLVREAPPLKIPDTDGHEVVSQKGSGSQMADSHIVHEVGPREDTYGPWMVVTRRSNGTKKRTVIAIPLPCRHSRAR